MLDCQLCCGMPFHPTQLHVAVGGLGGLVGVGAYSDGGVGDEGCAGCWGMRAGGRALAIQWGNTSLVP